MDVGELLAAERAAGTAGESVAHWWNELASAAESALTSQSLDALLRGAMVTMKEALEVDTVALLLANEPGDELIARAAIGLSEELSLDLGIRAGEGMAGSVLASQEPLVVDDLTKIRVVSPVLRDSGLRSIVAVPLLSEGHPLGVLYAGSYQLDWFTEADAAVLQLVADRLSTTLERVRLFETERAARDKAEKLADRLARMQEATARLATVQSVVDAAAILAESLVTDRATGGPCWAAVWLRRGDRLAPVGLATNAGPPPALDTVGADDELPVATVCRERRAVYWEGADGPERAVPVVPDPMGTPPTGSGGGLALLPVLLDGEGVGTVAVAFTEPHKF
ncbi:MAG TPA: GAF domain-containing protein, partial [Acidimicrobiales bacterium]|nr:GAF domain-containing protein [Acidimicrobiales bacterium]